MSEFSSEFEDWSDTEYNLYADLLGDDPDLIDDERLQIEFHEALFDRELDAETREEIYNDLLDYLDELGIDFEAEFDWIEYREWYDAA